MNVYERIFCYDQMPERMFHDEPMWGYEQVFGYFLCLFK